MDGPSCIIHQGVTAAVGPRWTVADQIAVRKMKYAATGEEDRCGRRRRRRRHYRRNRSRDNVKYLLRLYISPFQRVGKYRSKWRQYNFVFLFVVRHTHSANNYKMKESPTRFSFLFWILICEDAWRKAWWNYEFCCGVVILKRYVT